MTRWLVDGMNLIGTRPTGWWRDRPKAMRELVQELDRLADVTADSVTVVFDGRPFEIEADAAEVLFATRGGRNAADDDIAALVAADGGLTVVTSDRELARSVREAGAEVVSSGMFRRRLDGLA